MISVWSDSAGIPSFPTLTRDIKTDVLIIGGGITGVLCAYFLHNAGVNYTLVEGKTIASGITKNTTAKITSQHGLLYSNLLQSFGLQKAGLYLRANQLAVEKYRSLCQSIDCGFEDKSAFVYSLSDGWKIEQEILALKRLGFEAAFEKELPLPLKIAGAVRFDNQAQFNPLKFLQAISKGLNIYENTFVEKLHGTTAVTAHAQISAQKVIVATHFPFINRHGSYFLKLYQHRSYAIALENAPDVGGMYVDEAENGMSFRNYNGLLLVGGGDHRTGKIGGGWRELRNFAKTNYPEAAEKYFWATQDCMSLDGVPYIGAYSSSTPNLFVASGFNKWGMTSAMVSAMILTDLTAKRENEYASVFSPQRNMLKPQLVSNIKETAANFFSLSPKRCAHLGCALKWNKLEHSWDCPCHGSRFGKDGAVIDNPSQKSIGG